jgi:pimeloyl-ACP methyl ester carboxylesterase
MNHPPLQSMQDVALGGIAETGYVRLGGVDQWVMIRGEHVANPALVVLHGGPGLSDTLFFRACNASLEKSFTVVLWEQRGTGKSYNRAIPRSSMTVAQLLSDLDELVEIVRARLGKTKVVILGHSWGSALGVLYAARFPDKVEAYVGVAQIGDWAAGESASYAHALTLAERTGARAVLKKLREIGPPPHDRRRLMIERTCAQRLAGQPAAKVLWNVARMMRRVPESLVEIPDTLRGFQFTLDAMWAEVSRLNMIEAVPTLRVPAFFMLGRRDPWVLPDSSMAYVDALQAPLKSVTWFEESGHEPFVDEPAKFSAAMVDFVRPVCALPDGPVRFPGDELLAGARAEVTHHVDIDVPPEQVWPWLVQMGRRRGGWYSWDVLDNGGTRSASRIIPELQKLAVGDVLPIRATGPDGFAVLALDPRRGLVLGDPTLLPGLPGGKKKRVCATWAFALEPLGTNATRLFVRVRAEYEPSVGAALVRPIVGALHDVMERKQLRTLKARAEERVSA